MGTPLGFVALLAGLLATTSGLANELLAGGAMVAIVSGVVAAIFTTKTKAELKALTGAAEAWREERDAEKAKADRLEESLRGETAARKAAEARTDITHLEKTIVSHHEESLAILRSIGETLQLLGQQGAK